MLHLNLDLHSLEQYVYDFTAQMQTKTERSVKILASMTHERIRSKAQTELKSTREIYLNALEDPKQVDPSIWMIVLKKEGLWIEDGKPAGSMIDAMLKSPKAKVGPKGKYMVIPFTHTDSFGSLKTSNSLTTVLQNQAKKELRRNDIPIKKLTRDASGKPVIGLVDYINGPGKKVQGTLDYLEKNKHFYKKTNSPAKISNMLDNMGIYQNEVIGKEGNVMTNKHGISMMSRSAKTFRIISESQKGTGLWRTSWKFSQALL